jgi:cytochrome c2
MKKGIDIIVLLSFTIVILILSSSLLTYHPPKHNNGPISNSDAQRLQLDESLNMKNSFTTNLYNGEWKDVQYSNIPSNTFGKKLFKANCTSCHYRSERQSTGPGLAEITTRAPSKEWVFNYIKDSREMLKKGDPYALKLAHDNPSVMTVFDGILTDEQIKAIVDYIFSEPQEQPVVTVIVP